MITESQVGTHTSPSIHKFLYTPSVRDRPASSREQHHQQATLRDRADVDVERRHIVSNLSHHQEMDFRLHEFCKNFHHGVDTGENLLYLQAVSRWSDFATGVQRLDQVQSRDHHLSRLCMLLAHTVTVTVTESQHY